MTRISGVWLSWGQAWLWDFYISTLEILEKRSPGSTLCSITSPEVWWGHLHTVLFRGFPVPWRSWSQAAVWWRAQQPTWAQGQLRQNSVGPTFWSGGSCLNTMSWQSQNDKNLACLLKFGCIHQSLNFSLMSDSKLFFSFTVPLALAGQPWTCETLSCERCLVAPLRVVGTELLQPSCLWTCHVC